MFCLPVIFMFSIVCNCGFTLAQNIENEIEGLKREVKELREEVELLQPKQNISNDDYGSESISRNTVEKQIQDEVEPLRSELKALKENFDNQQLPQYSFLDMKKHLMNNMLDVFGLEFYGHVTLNAIVQDASSTGVSDIDGIMWADPDPPGADNDSKFSLHARRSRFGLNYRSNVPADYLMGGKLDGKIEADFWPGGDSPSRNILRMRHAFLRSMWEGTDISVMAGQYWDIISPLYPTADLNLILWNSGNLGDRRPQIRASWQPSFGSADIDITAGIFRTEAVGRQNLDGAGADDGVQSGKPMYQGRIGIKFPGWVKDKKVALGISGHSSREHSSTPVGMDQEQNFKSHSLNIDLDIPILSGLLMARDFLQIRSELFTGRNLNDLRGGVGQGVNAVDGDEIDSKGGWMELKYTFNDFWNITGGYAVDDPQDSDLPVIVPGEGDNPSRKDNKTFYLTNWFNFGSKLDVFIVYENHQTSFFGSDNDGDVNRFSTFFRYTF